jgi:hypothetical protein
VCDGSRSGGGGGQRPAAGHVPTGPAGTAALGLLAALLTLAACGPRAENFPTGGADKGAKPAIISGNGQSYISDPDWNIDGSDVTFPIPFTVRAQDPDANMRFVDIDVGYVDPCDDSQQDIELTQELPADDWARTEILVSDETTDKVRVPQACYPSDDLFNVRLRVRDSRGNLSNVLQDDLHVGAGQGPGAQ